MSNCVWEERREGKNLNKAKRRTEYIYHLIDQIIMESQETVIHEQQLLSDTAQIEQKTTDSRALIKVIKKQTDKIQYPLLISPKSYKYRKFSTDKSKLIISNKEKGNLFAKSIKSNKSVEVLRGKHDVCRHTYGFKFQTDDMIQKKQAKNFKDPNKHSGWGLLQNVQHWLKNSNTPQYLDVNKSSEENTKNITNFKTHKELDTLPMLNRGPIVLLNHSKKVTKVTNRPNKMILSSTSRKDLIKFVATKKDISENIINSANSSIVLSHTYTKGSEVKMSLKQIKNIGKTSISDNSKIFSVVEEESKRTKIFETMNPSSNVKNRNSNQIIVATNSWMNKSYNNIGSYKSTKYIQDTPTNLKSPTQRKIVTSFSNSELNRDDISETSNNADRIISNMFPILPISPTNHAKSHKCAIPRSKQELKDTTSEIPLLTADMESWKSKNDKDICSGPVTTSKNSDEILNTSDFQEEEIVRSLKVDDNIPIFSEKVQLARRREKIDKNWVELSDSNRLFTERRSWILNVVPPKFSHLFYCFCVSMDKLGKPEAKRAALERLKEAADIHFLRKKASFLKDQDFTQFRYTREQLKMAKMLSEAFEHEPVSNHAHQVVFNETKEKYGHKISYNYRTNALTDDSTEELSKNELNLCNLETQQPVTHQHTSSALLAYKTDLKTISSVPHDGQCAIKIKKSILSENIVSSQVQETIDLTMENDQSSTNSGEDSSSDNISSAINLMKNSGYDMETWENKINSKSFNRKKRLSPIKTNLILKKSIVNFKSNNEPNYSFEEELTRDHPSRMQIIDVEKLSYKQEGTKTNETNKHNLYVANNSKKRNLQKRKLSRNMRSSPTFVNKSPRTLIIYQERQKNHYLKKEFQTIKRLNKPILITYIQKGITEHTPYHAHKNVSSSNDICNILNYEYSGLYHFQKLPSHLSYIPLSNTSSKQNISILLQTTQTNKNITTYPLPSLVTNKNITGDSQQIINENKVLPSSIEIQDIFERNDLVNESTGRNEMESTAESVSDTIQAWQNEWKNGIKYCTIYFDPNYPANTNPEQKVAWDHIEKLFRIWFNKLNANISTYIVGKFDHLTKQSNLETRFIFIEEKDRIRVWDYEKVIKFFSNMSFDVSHILDLSDLCKKKSDSSKAHAEKLKIRRISPSIKLIDTENQKTLQTKINLGHRAYNFQEKQKNTDTLTQIQDTYNITTNPKSSLEFTRQGILYQTATPTAVKPNIKDIKNFKQNNIHYDAKLIRVLSDEIISNQLKISSLTGQLKESRKDIQMLLDKLEVANDSNYYKDSIIIKLMKELKTIRRQINNK